MLVLGVMFYVVCWCGLFGRKQDGSHGAAQRTDVRDSAKNQDEGDKNDNNNLAIRNFRNNNNNVASGDEVDANVGGGLRKRNLAGQTIALSDAPIVAPRQECIAVAPPPPPSTSTPPHGKSAPMAFQSGAPLGVQSLPNILTIASTDFSDEE